MTEREYAPLSIACVRGLCDKIYEKRKFAGGEIEKMVKDFSDAKNTSQIKRLIKVLGQDLMSSTNPNVKNGALMGLSSVAVGLGKNCVEHLSELIHPIVACFSESESRVRYQAVEALFNVVKIARGASLAHFPLIFDALARLAADSEPQVKQAAELLDRLVKDIVTESPAFEVGEFVSLVRERMYARAPGARQFAAAWLAVLHAVPGVDLLPHLPELLDGLLGMLDDPVAEIRRVCEVQLEEFRRSVAAAPERVDCAALVPLAVARALAAPPQPQRAALAWLRDLLRLAGPAVLPHASGALAAVLPCLAYADDARKNIRELASTVNTQLLRLVEAGAEAGEGEGEGAAGRPDAQAMVGVLTHMLHATSVHTKVAALDWILHLYNALPREMSAQTEAVFAGAVGSLTDGSDDVVRRALAVLAEICSCGGGAGARLAPGDLETSPYFSKFLEALLELLAADDNLLEDRGAFIIRQLCVLLNAEQVFVALSGALAAHAELRFVATCVHLLATILLTAAELYELRLQLRAFGPATRPLFESLYRCWSHAPVSLLALCLLTHNYDHCRDLIATFGDLEITVDFLTELDKLVQLIESPIFAYLRLELLAGARSEALRGALYGVLMLLPQSEAFHTLRRRLQCAPPAPAPAPAAAAPAPAAAVDFPALLEHFRAVQREQRRYRMLDRPRHHAYS